MLNRGRRSVQRAREVLNEGIPELVAKVDRGEVSVTAAADLAGLPQTRTARNRGARRTVSADAPPNYYQQDDSDCYRQNGAHDADPFAFDNVIC